ncbi:MAG: hypothetical protein ACYTHJ_00235 [Planctomycetota bacterium]|jgi:hypothetical protein
MVKACPPDPALIRKRVPPALVPKMGDLILDNQVRHRTLLSRRIPGTTG